MPSSYTLGKHYEAFVKAQLASGRYNRWWATRSGLWKNASASWRPSMPLSNAALPTAKPAASVTLTRYAMR